MFNSLRMCGLETAILCLSLLKLARIIKVRIIEHNFYHKDRCPKLSCV